MLTEYFLELRHQTGHPARKVCKFYPKNITRLEEKRKEKERKERKWKGEMMKKKKKNSVGVNQSCKARIFPRIKDNVYVSSPTRCTNSYK